MGYYNEVKNGKQENVDCGCSHGDPTGRNGQAKNLHDTQKDAFFLHSHF